MTTAHDSPDSAELAPPQDDLATRKTLGPYELKKKLGQGGMGAVYLAVDPALKRQCALKILPREKASNPQLVKRFKAEAQNASLLTHDNIVAVYGAGEADGYLYIALEYIDGIDVHDLVQRRGILPVKRSIDIIKQVAHALQHALDQGIVHRDIKPANLLIRRDGMVKLADMGLARAVDETMETGITRAGTTVGTVDYMSPEQARNSKSADVRSDIYSLGCTWYHMLTGAPPYSEGSLVNKLNAHAKQPAPDPRDKNPSVPEGVVAVMQRMLAKNPDDRYQTPGELVKDLEGALVNRDAVSQRILEAIDDDSVHGDEDDYSTESSSTTTGQPDSYQVEMPWTDSVAEMQSPPHGSPIARRTSHSVEPEEVEDEVEESHPTRPATGKTKPPPKGTSSSLPPNTRQTPTAPASQQSTSTNHKTTSPPQKPAANPGRSTHTQSSGKAAVTSPSTPSRSLPPPKRKSLDDPSLNTDNAKSSPVKLMLTVLAVLAGLGVLVFLVNLAQQAGETIDIPSANGNGQAQAPVPVAVVPGPAEGVAATDGENPTVKDVLIERQDDLEGNSTLGEGAKKGAGGTQNVAAIRTGGPQFLPEWVDAGLEANLVPMFSISKGPTVESERRYATLQEAFKRAGTGGARIVLFHNGPFDLIPTEIPSGMLIIEAAQGVQPQIRLVAEGEHHKLPWLNVTNGSLALDGVDFIGNEGAVPVADPWSWIRVTNGHLYVRRSSFTLTGKRTAPTTVLRLSGVVTDPVTKEVTAPRFLLDQSVIRGENMRCVQLESPGFDGVLRQSLLVSGDSPAITIRGTDKALPKTPRQLKIVHTTVNSREQAFLLSSQGVINPTPTELVSLESLFSAPANAPHPVLLSLEDWPATKPRASDAPPYKNLRWKATGSAVLGFRPLLKVSNDESADVADGPAWKKLFKDEAPTTYSSLNWPTDVPGSNSAAPLKTWSLKSLDALSLAFPTADVTPGCPVTNLRAPEFADATSKPVSNQPQRPRAPIPFVAKSVQQVDLGKTDLGKLLASKEWEDGTVFVASGSGQKQSSAITVERRNWRIQFRQTEGPPLVISPRASARSGGEDSAFITIRGGQLELEHGTFTYDARDQQSVTPWFLYAEGGGFSLLNCRIHVPQIAASRTRGIIRWAAPATPEKAAPDSEFANFGQIADSLLIGSGVLFSADLDHRAVLLNNSAFLSRQHLFEMNVGMNDGKAPAAFDAQHCSYVAGGTHWSVKSQAPAGSHPLPARLANRDCVFAALPPDPTAKVAPLLMNYAGPVPAVEQILWYEESCGYAPELKAFLATDPLPPTAPVKAQDFDGVWAKLWGVDRVQRPLVGPTGVLFEKNLTGIPAQFKTEILKFHKTSKARSWSESGGPIGVRLEALEPPPAPPKAAVPKATPGNKKPMIKGTPKVTL